MKHTPGVRPVCASPMARRRRLTGSSAIWTCEQHVRVLLGETLPEAKDLSCSGFVLLLSVEKADHGLQHHNVLFSPDYEREFADIFEHRILPRNPTVYIARSAATDPTQAPSDRENWFILVNAPTRYHDHRTRTRPVCGGGPASNGAVQRRRHRSVPCRSGRLKTWLGSGMPRVVRCTVGRRIPCSRHFYVNANDPHEFVIFGMLEVALIPEGGVPLVAISGTIAARLIQNEDR